MPKRKSFPLRLDPKLYEQLRRWADDEFRSVNGQIEFLIRRALTQAGRWPAKGRGGDGDGEGDAGDSGRSGDDSEGSES